MSRKSRMADLRQAKDRRAKRMAIGGVVLLAAVLAFEVPKVLKSSGGSSSSPPAATTTAAASGVSTTPATTGSGTAVAAVLPASSTKLPNSDQAPRRLKSQLYSFSHFAGKDPFVQQVSASDITSSPSMGAGAAPSGGSAKSGTKSGSGSAGGSTSGASYSAPSQRTLAQTGAVTIEVNGKLQTVRIGASFPSSNPLFKLVSISRGVARIGIANGSYASGAQTVTLPSGRSLTLVDTADGVRYKLELLSAS
jgi:hypothetical protein